MIFKIEVNLGKYGIYIHISKCYLGFVLLVYHWRLAFFVSVVLMFSMQKDIVTFSEQFNTNRKYSNILRIVKHNLT